MAETISLNVLSAIKDSMKTYLPSKIPSMEMGKVNWRYGDTFADPGQCPIICIADRGWTKTDETCRGASLSGAAIGGMVWRKASVEVIVWLAGGGTDDQDLRAKLQTWCDAVAAVAESDYHHEDFQLIVAATGAANLETTKTGSTLWLGAGQVKLSVDIFSQQGAVALTQSNPLPITDPLGGGGGGGLYQ